MYYRSPINEIPEPPIDPPREKIIAYCDKCGEEISEVEIYGEDDMGYPICCNCIEREWDKLSVYKKIELLGYKVAV